MKRLPNYLIMSALLLVALTISASARIEATTLNDGDRTIVNCAADELFIARQTTTSIALDCLAYTPTSTPAPSEPVVAFPEAEGFGAQAVGGRGGQVIEVTNLNDSGQGSLRACIRTMGPLTCVFRVAGIITLRYMLEITNPYITIAGQTAPGGGILLKASNPASDAHIQIRTHDVILRYISSRPGTRQRNARALSINNGQAPPDNAHNVIVDHFSGSWAGDEILIMWNRTSDITVQWSILAESLPNPVGSGSIGLKGPNLGDENGGGNYTLHHNLIAHHTQRYPKVNTAGGPVDLVNNVMYNMGGLGSIVQAPARVNYVNNYIKAGPNTHLSAFVDKQGGSYYASGNVLQGLASFGKATDNPSATRFAAPPVTTSSASVAYDDVLATAGNYQRLACDGTWVMRRDSVDTRIAQSVKDGTRGHDIAPANTFSGLGYISSPNDVGGWPMLDPGTPCLDTDHDGMPDEWELAQGFDVMVNDSALVIADGYYPVGALSQWHGLTSDVTTSKEA